MVEKGFWFAKGAHAESVRFEQSTDRLSHRWVVINETDNFRVRNFGLAAF
jgi:hypothetical protein